MRRVASSVVSRVVRRALAAVAATGVLLAGAAVSVPAAHASSLPTGIGAADSPAPIPATRTQKARNVPDFPTNSRLKGKRIVYDKALMTIWLIDGSEQVVARYPVVGRQDRPAMGAYRVYSKSPHSANRIQRLTFDNMVRFAHGSNTGAPIGFHDIPRTYDGRPIHSENVLGLPLGVGGCVRMSESASAVVYAFASVGTAVEVVS